MNSFLIVFRSFRNCPGFTAADYVFDVKEFGLMSGANENMFRRFHRFLMFDFAYGSCLESKKLGGESQFLKLLSCMGFRAQSEEFRHAAFL